MQPPTAEARRAVLFPLCATLLAFFPACNQRWDAPLSSPTGPSQAPASFTLDAPYDGEGVLVVNGIPAPCEWRVSTDAVEGLWLVRISGDQISFLFDGDGINYATIEGTLTGASFVAKTRPNNAFGNCVLREEWLSGSFSEDFSLLEAYHTVVVGPPDDQSTVEWRWSARRR